MIRIYGSENTISWPIILAVIYGIFVIVTAILALILAYRGGESNPLVPERYRNRRWAKPLVLIIFVILPALLWPLVMVGVVVCAVVSVIWVSVFDCDGGFWRKMRGSNKAKDVESGAGANSGLLNEQSSSECNQPAYRQPDNTTTISEPLPSYNPLATSRRLPEETGH